MVKIAVIGDVHDQWEEEDQWALQLLKVDLALFVGDFGNESLEIVEKIARLPLPKAVILGNHDAWYTATPWGQKKCPYDQNKEDRVQKQVDLLGKSYVGYSNLDFPQFQLSVVGSRPFSWGGNDWKCEEFLKQRYNVSNFKESQSKIVQAVQQTAYQTVIFLGHNGPSSLGNGPEDICGRDWKPLGGDHGDPDLEGAIFAAKTLGKRVSLVTFGHMHHRLRHTQERLRTKVTTDATGTIYLNAASVPRIIDKGSEKWRNFTLVTLKDAQVKESSLVWVGENGQIMSQEWLYSSDFQTLKQI